MKIDLWQGQEFEHAHEARALQALLTQLRQQDGDDFLMVCANFFCAGEQIDLMVIKRHAVVVIELKDASGLIEGGENGDWLVTDAEGTRTRLNPGRRNPYEQARAMRYSVVDFLRERATAFISPQKAMQLDFMHVAAVVTFTGYDPHSKLDLPHAPWFSVVGTDRLVEEIQARRSPKLNFSRKETTALVRDVLRLRQVQTQDRPIEATKTEPDLQLEEPTTEPAVEVDAAPDTTPCIVCGDQHTCTIPRLLGTIISSSKARPLEKLNLVVFDVETTGIEPLAGERVVEVAAKKMSEGEVVSHFRELVYSGVPVGDSVKIHGYTDEHLREHGKPPEEVFPRFVQYVGDDILVAHNLPFDWSFVNHELALLGMPLLQNATIDTLDLSRRLLPHLKNHKLVTMARHFGISLEDAHHALADASALWPLLQELAQIAESADMSIDPERIVVFMSSEGRSYQIRMIDFWSEVVQEVEFIHNHNVLGDPDLPVMVAIHHVLPDPTDPHGLLAGHDSLVIIEPDWLIDVSSLMAVGTCDREYLVGRFTPREPNEPMVVGGLAHRCLEAILRDPGDEKGLGNAFYGGTRDMAESLVALDMYEESIASKVRNHARILSNWVRELPFRGQRSPETFVFSPQLGLKGVIDALWKDHDGHPTAVVELKTGKASWKDEPREGHALQAGAYALMLQARDPSRSIQPPIVLYTGGQPKEGSGTEKVVSMSPRLAAGILAARNRALVVDYCLDALKGGDLPCPRCWSKEGCSLLTLLTGGRAKVAPPQELDSAPFDDHDRRFFTHYSTLLARDYKTFKDGHQNLWKDEPKKREEEGTAVYVPEIGEPQSTEGGFLHHMPCDNRSELREGQFVILSDGDLTGSSQLATGIIQATSRAGISVRTTSKLTLDLAWVDGYSGERLMESGFRSLYDWMVSKSQVARRLVIDGDCAPRFGEAQEVPSRPQFGDKPLNDRQKYALSRALAVEDYLLVQGPPGSGKTVLIGALIRALMEKGDRVLLAANTNQALDKVILALMEQGLGDAVVRLGKRASITDQLVQGRLIEELALSSDPSHYLESFKELLTTTPVIAATVTKWQTFPRGLAQRLFDVAIVDEATQISVPSALGVLRHVDSFILLGDPHQLPPVVLHDSREDEDRSAEAEDGKTNGYGPKWPPLSRSLFEILLEKLQRLGNSDGIVNLEEQYRMNQTICRFPSGEWYGGNLRPAAEIVGRSEWAMPLGTSEGPWSEALSPEKHLVIIDVPGSADAGYMPRTNQAEARIVSELMLAARQAGAQAEDIAVITPYRAQVAWIRRELEEDGQGTLTSDQIRYMVDTVDRFQGEERPMVLVSFSTYGQTLSDHLKNQRRLNVALTRAKHKLILIGDRQVLSQDDVYARLFASGEDAHTLMMTCPPPADEDFKAF